jgi:hypothetical protein
MYSKDIISKQTIGKLATDIATLLLGLDIDPDQVEILETEQQRIEIRRADLVARMIDRQTQQPFILHIEIQNNNHPMMPLRMMRYYTDIKLQWSDEPVQQYLIYIGERKLTMPNEQREAAFTYRYQILDMRTVDCAMLLAKDTPEALVLAILCDFKDRPAADVVQYIVQRLYTLCHDDEKGFRNYLTMLEILSDNRQLKQQIKEAETMLTNITLENLPSYELGEERGITIGEEQGIVIGVESVVINLFDVLDNEAIAQRTGLSLERIKQLRQAHQPSH